MSLLAGLRKIGLTVWRDGPELVVEGDSSAITEAVAASIRYAKADLLAELDAEQPRQPDPLAAFLADPHGTPQADLDRLLAVAHGLPDADLESLNRALAERHGLDFDEACSAAREFDRPPEPPIEL